MFLGSQKQKKSVENEVAAIEINLENMNIRLSRLFAEFSSSQYKIKRRISLLENMKYKSG